MKDGGMRRNSFGGMQAFALFLAISLVEPGYTGTEQKSAKASAPSFERIQQGKTLYEGLARCIHCHGQTALRRTLTRQKLFTIIKFGVPGTSHMPFKHLLSDEEIWSIVHYQLHDICIHGCTN